MSQGFWEGAHLTILLGTVKHLLRGSQCKNYLQTPHPETHTLYTSHFSLPRRRGLPGRATAFVRHDRGRDCVIGWSVLKENGD